MRRHNVYYSQVLPEILYILASTTIILFLQKKKKTPLNLFVFNDVFATSHGWHGFFYPSFLFLKYHVSKLPYDARSIFQALTEM